MTVSSAKGTAESPSVLGSTVVLLASRITGVCLGLMSFVLVARALGPRQYGLFSLGLSMAYIGYLLGDLRLSSLYIRESGVDPSAERSLYQWTELLRIVIGLIFAIVFVALGHVLTGGRHNGTIPIAVMAITIPVNGLSLSLTHLQRNGRLRVLGALFVGQSVVWLVLVALVSWQSPTTLSFAMAFLSASLAFNLAARFVALRGGLMDDVSLTFAEFRSRVDDAWIQGLSGAIVAAYYRIDSLLVFRLGGASTAGFYGVGYRFVDQSHVVPQTLSAAVYPRLSRATTAARRPLATAYFELTLLVSVTLAVIAYGLAGGFVEFAFGPAFRPAAPMLRVLLVATIPISLGYVVTSLATLDRQALLQLRVAAAALTANVLLNLWLIRLWGGEGAAWATVATEMLVVCLLTRFLCRTGSLTIRLGWHVRLVPVVLALVVAGEMAPGDPWIRAAGQALLLPLGVRVFKLLDPSHLGLFIREAGSEP